MPRLGGLAIVVAFFAPLLALLFVDSEAGRRFWAEPREAVGLFLGGLAITALGVLDDLKGTGARTKFTVQFAVAAGMYWVGYRIDAITTPFGPSLELGLLGLPLTMLWIAGIINAVNLIDGLDGLAGGVALIAVSTVFAMAAIGNQGQMLLFAGALGGAIVGFLIYNFNPATIFMGDTGSMFLGFVLAVTSLRTSTKATTAVALMVPIIALGVPIADTLLAMFRRALRGVPMFSADRGHIHHRLLDLGLSHRQAVLAIYGAAVFLGGAALTLSFANSHQAAVLLLVLSGLAFVALRALGFMDLRKAQAALGDRRRNLDIRAAVRRAGEALRSAESAEAAWAIVRDTAPAFGASGVGLTLGRLDGRPACGPWELGIEGLPAHGLRARFGLITERPGDDHLDLAWTDGRTVIYRDTEIAIELLCEHLATAVERLERPGAGT